MITEKDTNCKLFFATSLPHHGASAMGIIRELSEQEKAIGQRLAAARRFAGLSQQELASELGLTRNQLANIETGRTELGFRIGWNACRRLGLRQLYLAHGTPPMTPFFDQINPLDTDLKKPSSSFYQAMTMTEAGSIGRLLAFTDEFLQKTRSPFNTFSDTASSLVQTFLSRLPEESYPNLMEHLFCALQAFELSVRRKAALPANSPANPEKNCLTPVDASVNMSEMKAQMESLRARLIGLTGEPGRKTDLAEYLGAPLASVSRWLSGERDPGGETALKMLRWVEQEERKKNPLGSDTSTAKGNEDPKKGSLSHETDQSKGRKKE